MGKVIITKTDNGIKEGLIEALEFAGRIGQFTGHDDHDPRQPLNNFRIAFGNCCSGDDTFSAKIRRCPPLPFNRNNCLKKKGLQIINNTS